MTSKVDKRDINPNVKVASALLQHSESTLQNFKKCSSKFGRSYSTTNMLHYPRRDNLKIGGVKTKNSILLALIDKKTQTKGQGHQAGSRSSERHSSRSKMRAMTKSLSLNRSVA